MLLALVLQDVHGLFGLPDVVRAAAPDAARPSSTALAGVRACARSALRTACAEDAVRDTAQDDDDTQDLHEDGVYNLALQLTACSLRGTASARGTTSPARLLSRCALRRRRGRRRGREACLGATLGRLSTPHY